MSKIRNETGIRFRQGRSDASIESITNAIESKFGLPKGCVKIIKKDGRKIRSDALLCTLRESWDK